MKHVCIWLIRLYQRFLSPLKRNPTCRFTPTCSAYALEAFKKRGFFVGFGLTVWRILRCQPMSRGGYDPVPERSDAKKGYKRIPKYQTLRDSEDSEKDKDRVNESSTNTIDKTHM